MKELYNLGISESTIKDMTMLNPNIINISNKEVLLKEEILEQVGCTDKEILSIISSNPLYLDQASDKTIQLIDYLNKIGFKDLNILFDSNPYILNLDIFEIEDYITKEKESGKLLEDIIDELDSNPYLFNEM